MGIPLHFLDSRFKDTWLESLKSELQDHATIVVVENTPHENYYSDRTIYVVGNNGYSVIYELEHASDESLRIHIRPFSCTAEGYGQGMVNQEERIHRIMDKMAAPIPQEAIERYEKSFMAKLYRLFGREYVDRQNFANREKVEIIEGTFDPDEVKLPYYLLPSFGSRIRCREEFRSNWPEHIQKCLQGLANAEVVSSPVRRIVSPNGRYALETATVVRIQLPKQCVSLQGEGHNFDSPEQGYYIRICLTKPELKQFRRHPVGQVVLAALQELSVENELTFF